MESSDEDWNLDKLAALDVYDYSALKSLTLNSFISILNTIGAYFRLVLFMSVTSCSFRGIKGSQSGAAS